MLSQCKKFLGSVTKPVKADAAAVYGEARYTWPSLCPILPGKFRFVVETQTCFQSPLISYIRRKTKIRNCDI